MQNKLLSIKKLQSVRQLSCGRKKDFAKNGIQLGLMSIYVYVKLYYYGDHFSINFVLVIFISINCYYDYVSSEIISYIRQISFEPEFYQFMFLSVVIVKHDEKVYQLQFN